MLRIPMPFILVVLLMSALLCGHDLVTADEAIPHWIWTPSDGAVVQVEDASSVRLSKRFQLDSSASAAVLRVAGFSTRIDVLLDGQIVATVKPYDPVREIDLPVRLESGEHEIVVAGSAVRGPSACFVEIRMSLRDGSHATIATDASWSSLGRDESLRPVADLGQVAAMFRVAGDRRVGIDVADNYEQWKQAIGTERGTDPASFLIAPGFEIRRIRSAQENEDSWISMEFDSQGRLVIAKEEAGLLRMTLSHDGNTVMESELINEDLKECRGLAFRGNDLYVNANNSKGLYRLRAQGQRFAEPELLFASSGGVGHGRNDLAIGPDGMLYCIHGDSVDLPTDAVDFTSPFREARRGRKTSEGHLLRIDPDSGTVEVLAAGLRNPFGIDFNRDGEIFTYDADAEYDMGAPWYRPTRVNHLVTGGDFGWRGVTKSWPPYFPDHPDNALPNLDIGKGSPTAVKFATRSNFPTRYRDSLFILDWAYGRILAVRFAPRGSSYIATSETFLKGRPLNVTDLGFAPSGSMYFVTGGRKTQSALYRVRYVGESEDQTTPTLTPFQVATRDFAAQSRLRRRSLESKLTQPPSEMTLEEAWNWLGDSDPWISHAAARVIEHQPTGVWQERALTESDVAIATGAMLLLARTGDESWKEPLLRRLSDLLPRLKNPTEKRNAYYALALSLQYDQPIDEALIADLTIKLARNYPIDSERFMNPPNRLLSEILVQLGDGDVVAKTLRRMTLATTPQERMECLFVLRNARRGWNLERRKTYFAGLAQAVQSLGGAGMPDFLARIREEAVGSLKVADRQALGKLIEPTLPQGELNELTDDAVARPFVKQWTVGELLHHAGEAENTEKTAVGDRSRGAALFAEADCVHCHRFGTRGTLIGPDLTAASRRFNRRDLLVSMIEPSKVIADNYRSLQIVTSDGRSYIGQATLGGDYRSPVLRLATDPRKPWETVEIPKAEIESKKVSDVSWMPAGLLDTFSRQEILDLIAYLQADPQQ